MSLAALALSPLTVAATASEAVQVVEAATASRQCTVQDSQNGVTHRWVTLDHKKNVITHAVKRRIEKNTRFDRSVTKTTTTVVRAEMTASSTVKAEAGAFFAKASAELSVSVAVGGEHTSSQSVSDHYTIPAKRHARNFVFYDGVKFFDMTWHRRHCGLPYGSITKHGDLKTYNRAEFGGSVLCPHSRYKRGSEPYTAALAGGC